MPQSPTTGNDARTFRVISSNEDQEYVSLVDDQYPSMSWLTGTEAEALDGIRRIVAEDENI